ncbi:autotransporter domain-containing protein [Desulfovibrio fairfieldensis]|uniref:Autotransporter domain-containing protein n=1 Tax=Desulfovibrio fairfieldensis TaxID=44742 RepID=A0A120KMG0_9BACT|nr:autotransporter domain-containing protein [Desulfovibrio fairfieldensis]AMD90801.1 hypothetical protein AXF13_12085 [Desulfovibrio fairfieldensis]
MLTKGAIGNLVNKYRAVLKKCRLLNLFGTLALTGALTVGAAGMAGAASVPAPWDEDVVNVSDATHKDVPVMPMIQDIEGVGAQNINATTLNILNGGELVLKDGARLAHYNYSHTGNPAIVGMSVNMSGGSLTITNGSGFSSIDANTAHIGGGEITLTGTTDGPWENAAYIGAYKGMDITGGTVNMGVNSELFAGNHLSITGGTINMQGTGTSGGFGNNAAHIMFTSENTIGGTTVINVDAGKYGVMSAPTLNMTGGKLNVNGNLLLQPDTGERGASVVYDGSADDGKSGVFNLSSGDVTVAKDGALYAPYTQINQEGGTLTVKGTLWTEKPDGSADGTQDNFSYTNSGYSLSDGKLVVKGDASANSGGSHGQLNGDMQVGNLEISGGTVEIGLAEGGSVTAWDNGPRLGGYGVNNESRTDISGGTVTLGTSGVLFAGVEAWKSGESGQMNLSGDAKIVMDGTNSVLYASSTDAGTDFVSLNISDNAGITVNAGKTGYILARETNMSGGSIDVAGALTVAGKSAKGGTVDAGLSVAKGGEFNLSGGAITVADKGKLDFATGGVNATLTGGSVTYNGGADGQLAFHGLTLAGGALNGVDSLTVDSSVAAKGVSASTLTVGGSGNAAKADLTLATLTQNAGAVAVNNGSLTVDSLNQSGGTLTVGGAGADGKLTVTGTTAGTSLKTTDVTVNNLGTLDVQSVVTGTFSSDVFTRNASVAQAEVNAGGTLKVNGFAEMSKAAFLDMKGKLVAGDGLLDLGSTKITGLVATDTSGNKTVAFDEVKTGGSTGGVKNDETLQATVTGASSATSLTGGYNKVVTSDSLKTESGTLQLAGNANGGNIVDKSGAAADISVGDNSAAKDAVVTLGTSDADNSGKVGNVTLAVNSTGTATLNAVGSGNAFFSTGTINGNGAVNAAGATLTADSIGATAVVAEVNGIGGTVFSKGVIKADKLTADNGTVRAEGDITVTSAVTGLNNGLVHSATGDVTLTAGASNASGAIVADAGNITASSQNITAAADEDLTLSAEKGTIAAKDVTATNVQAKTLTATGAVTVTDGVLIATGTGADASSVDGTLNLSDATARVGDLDVTGAATIEGGSFTGNAVTLSGGGEISNGAQVTVDTLTGAGQTIKVGSDTDTVATSLTVNTLDMAGGSLLIDPAWTSGSNVMAVGDFDSGDIDVLAGVGQNSMLLIGSADANWLTSQVNAATNGAGLTRNGVDSVLGIYSSQTLDNTNGGIQVDGTKTNSGVTSLSPAANTADFSGKSLLVVNADAATGGNVALTATGGTLNLTDGAKLRIAGAKIGADYTVVDGFTTTNYLKADGTTPTTEADSTAWVGANLSTDSKLVHLEKSATGEYKGALTSAAAFMPKLDGELVKVVNNMALAGNTGTAGEMSETKGVRFLNRAISEKYLNNDAAAAVTIESAARMALVGAVPQMTMAASNAAGNAVTQRTSLAQPGGNAIQSVAPDGSMQTGASAGDAAKTGFAMWIMPLYQSSNGYGMKAGNFDMDFSGGLGGVAIGADYTFDNAIRAGITFNIGGGYATGSGDLNETTNNMNFWGIGAYAGWAQNNFGVTADVNYTSTYNKLEQDLPASMQMGKLKSDVTAYAISAGLRGEYRFETSVMDITPHVGVRYMSLNTDEYDVKSGGTLLKGDAINQSIWTFPVGVAFSKQIETGNGWHFKPSLDLAVIPAAGDIDARSDVRFTGTGTKAELDTQTMDYVSYMGGLGLEFGNDTTSLGVNYNIQLGAKSTAHGVFGTFRYEF